jgi:hypothetical protein
MLYFIVSLAIAECPNAEPLKSVFWGDLHVHTAHSLDASLQGTTQTHQQAYAFAKGEIETQGQRLLVPLDFVAITDHAEFLGEIDICSDPNQQGYKSLSCRLYRSHSRAAFILLNSTLSKSPKGDPLSLERWRMCRREGVECDQRAIATWAEMQSVAEGNNEPCSFTTFHAYEWSASPKTNNLHRNIVFMNRETPKRPISYFDQPTPEQLWDALDDECIWPCDYLSIPHNSNLSGGRMFVPYSEGDEEELRQYARKRIEHEPLIEIFQHKGSSECSPFGPDEQCTFEYVPFNNLIADRYNGRLTQTPTDQDFVRWALKEGLVFEYHTELNPYMYGFVSSTDTHLGTPGLVDEEQFVGHGGAGESSEDGLVDSPYFNPGGLTGVWATENTRASLFTALKNREVYGTSGPRIELRFFATNTANDATCGSDDWLHNAYQGTSMGGTGDGYSFFHVWVSPDEDSNPIQDIQIIKGWLDGTKPEETIYSVKSKNSGLECISWEDPDPSSGLSFYYARVLEEPSARWSVSECQQETCPDSIQQLIQERAWSSPIWIHN